MVMKPKYKPKYTSETTNSGGPHAVAWSTGMRHTLLKWTNTHGHTTSLAEPQKTGDVGYDLETAVSVVVHPDRVAMVPTGVAVQIPHGYWGFIHARSSALSNGLVVYSGIIDEGYRGELFVRCHTTVEAGEMAVDAGTRLAQLILMPATVVRALRVDSLDESERGATGFGSTGGTA